MSQKLIVGIVAVVVVVGGIIAYASRSSSHDAMDAGANMMVDESATPTPIVDDAMHDQDTMEASGSMMEDDGAMMQDDAQ